ncbi:MAG: efflux RND transporter periplasmic adaptor subunit [Candidatus Obscuribacter sp.]|nr:efflux RND transporter periplasmic adaptor subunit [Candidatus Obscuribacter sp.]
MLGSGKSLRRLRKLARVVLLTISTSVLSPALCLAATIAADGRIEQSDNTSFHVHAMLPGSVCQDNAVIGKYYHKGDLLAEMESAELVRQSADLLSQREELEMSIRKRESAGRVAKSALARIQQLVKEGIAAEKVLQQAVEDVRTAAEDLEDLNEQRVRLDNECQTLATMYGVKLEDPKQQIPSKLPLRAPNSGVIIAKNVSLGDRVTVDDAAYVLASISDVNLKISLPVIEQRHVAIGQHVEFWCQQLPRKNFVGDIDSLRFSSDCSSSHFTVNVTLKNPQAALRPGMSGQAKISVK